jgi:hypothetical protein
MRTLSPMVVFGSWLQGKAMSRMPERVSDPVTAHAINQIDSYIAIRRTDRSSTRLPLTLI